MSRGRGWVAGVLAVVLALAVSACAMDSLADLAEAREQVRTATARDVPALAGALGGTITAARGAHEGGGVINNTWWYTTTVTIDGSVSTAEQVAEALTGLGYDDVQIDRSSVMAARDGLTLTTWAGSAPFDVLIDGPRLTIPDQDDPPRAEEHVDLPGLEVPQRADFYTSLVRRVAGRELPALAEALGGTIVAARGQHLAGAQDEYYSYEARVVIEGPQRTSAQIAEAFEALGWQDIEADETGVTGEDDGLTLTATGGPASLVVVLRGEFVRLPEGNTASVGGEDLVLPGIDVPQTEPEP